MQSARRFCLFCLALLAAPALANDGFGGFSATGLTFSETDKVAMVEEDLFISLDRIRVSYLFRNISDQDVTGEVIFPMPPISLETLLYSPTNLPEDLTRENLVDFTATIDGVDVPVSIDRIAVLGPPSGQDQMGPLSEQYDSPGPDVTADLERLGIPLTLDAVAAVEALKALGPEAKAELQERELAWFDEGGEAYPLWSIVYRYHWTQTFPAGAEMTVAHEYTNLPSGGLFAWTHPADDEYDWEFVASYCIDEGTSKAMAKTTEIIGDDGQTYSNGVVYDISYVLKTANSWAGPIEKFRLTVDKGAPENVLSFCGEGVKKTGPTTFVMEKANYAPAGDLSIMVLTPINQD
jgi:hypothetical protein